MHDDASDGFAPRRHRHHDVHIDFTPMIDCMFLLLMFNMIAFVLTGSSDLDLPKAKYAKGNDAAEATTITIRQPARIGDPATIQIEGVQTERGATLAQVRAAVEQAVAKGKTQVVLRSERLVKVRDLMDVAGEVGQVEGTSLLLAVQHETTK